MSELLSYRRAAKHFGIHVCELQRGVNRGQLRQKHFKDRVGFDPSEVEAWLWTQSRMAERRSYVRGAGEIIAFLARCQPDNRFLPEALRKAGISSTEAKLAGLSDIDVGSIRELESIAAAEGSAA